MGEVLMTHTDIRRDSWIRFLPGFLHPYALLMRLDRPIGTWLLLLPGWWGIALGAKQAWAAPSLQQQAWLFALFAAGAVIMRGAGCIVNDLWDRDLDRKVARTAGRPLASGALSPGRAIVFLALLLMLGLAILLQLSPVAICLGVLSLPFIAIYPLMKRITWWPQAFLGLTFNFGALMGWAAVTGMLSLPALSLYAAGFFWTLGYDTIYAWQDIEDDAMAGIKSSARRLGGRSKIFVCFSYGISWLLLEAAFWLAGAVPITRLALILPLLHLLWQIKHWNMADPASSLLVFRMNRDFGLLVLLAAAL